MFESFVNSERCKTFDIKGLRDMMFESFVNSERCKTGNRIEVNIYCLRALLIQKDVKPASASVSMTDAFESFVNSERCKTRLCHRP